MNISPGFDNTWNSKNNNNKQNIAKIIIVINNSSIDNDNRSYGYGPVWAGMGLGSNWAPEKQIVNTKNRHSNLWSESGKCWSIESIPICSVKQCYPSYIYIYIYIYTYIYMGSVRFPGPLGSMFWVCSDMLLLVGIHTHTYIYRLTWSKL